MKHSFGKVVWSILATLAAAGCFWAHLAFSERRAVRRVQAARRDVCARFGIVTDGSSPFVALPPMLPHADASARLGRDLFREPRLAKSRDRMCVSCHPPNEGGTDGKCHGGALTRPAENAVFADVFLHDGSVTGLTELVARMIDGPNFCGARSLSSAVERLAGHGKIASRFESVYHERPSVSNVVDALACYHRTLLTPQGAFDRFCAGDASALSDEARSGAKLFIKADCTACHNGPALGGLSVYEGRKVPALRGISRRRAFSAGGTVRTDLSAILAFMPGADTLDGEGTRRLLAFLRAL